MKQATGFLALFAFCGALFLLAPQLDLLTSGLFYAPSRGFFLKNWPPAALIHHAVPWLAWGIVVIVGFGVVWLFLAGRPLWRLDRRALCFLVLSTALGPGLVVNVVLKDHWGRARPDQIEAFGGTHRYTPALLPAAECPRNCSFPSGHAALGFSLVAFAFLLPPGAARRRGIAATLGLGAVVGLARIAEGAHFLSDVVFAGLLVYGIAAALHFWVIERDGLAAPGLVRLYRSTGRFTAAGCRLAGRIRSSPALGLASGTAVVAILVALAITTWDRPLAVFFHAQGPGVHALFAGLSRLGLGYGWLIVFGAGFAALRWGCTVPRLMPWRSRLCAWSSIPAFLFASVAAAGIAADMLKVVFGRARPKLFFAAKTYGFTWFGWHADLWSFPSGHTATIVALMAALWHLWPNHILFYMLVGAAVAASRVVVGAHFLSDVLAGAWLAVLTTRAVVFLFARRGIDLAAARLARPPLAPTSEAVVSAHEHGPADRHL